MEGLIELVAASFARHGIECPADDSPVVWGQPPAPSSTERVADLTLIAALPGRNLRKGPQPDPAP
jgi:hypothetical protein